MFNVVTAELRKMRRPSLLYVIVSLLTLLSIIFTSLVFLRTSSTSGKRGSISGTVQSTESLSKFDGGYFTFGLMGLFLGLIALTVLPLKVPTNIPLARFGIFSYGNQIDSCYSEENF